MWLCLPGSSQSQILSLVSQAKTHGNCKNLDRQSASSRETLEKASIRTLSKVKKLRKSLAQGEKCSYN